VFIDNPLYYLVQIATLLILVVAANTSFLAFPQLSARLAHDGFLPRPLSNLGDCLVFANGILMLAGVSSLLVIVFQGNTHLLIPLYAIGVFVGFALTQTGMTVYWWRWREQGWHHGLAVSGIGAVVTGVVMLILVIEKFGSGAWIVVASIPVILLLFTTIRRHYLRGCLRRVEGLS
jgi:hypothetical protein